MCVLIMITIALALLILALAVALSGYATHIRPQSLTQARARQEKHYNLSWYDGLKKQDYVVTGNDGYALHVQLLINPEPANRCVIISHGYTDNRFGAMKYASIYLALGFDVIVYDLRGHGENAPARCSYSLRESDDLNALICDTRRRMPDLQALGLHGESMGSATSVMALGARAPVDFLVSDCGYADLSLLLRDLIGKEYRLPAFLVYPASLMSRLRFGFGYGGVRPVAALARSDVPALFIHGGADTFVLPRHAIIFHEAAQGMKRLLIVEGAKHAAALRTDPAGYEAAVREFLAACGVL